MMKNQDACYLIPKTTYKEMAAIIDRGDVVVANCSGPKHVATGLGKKVVTIFGPTHPEVWEHYQTGRNVALQAKGLECLACEKNECPRDRHYCMEAVTPEMVYQAVLDLLKKQ
jgi:ADP-heptose:LPS heptosyltransferase